MISNLLLTANQPSKILPQILEMSTHLSSVCMFESHICDNILSYSALSILRSSSLQYQFISRIRVSLVFMLNCSVYRVSNCPLSVLNVICCYNQPLLYIFLIVITSFVVCLCISILRTPGINICIDIYTV